MPNESRNLAVSADDGGLTERFTRPVPIKVIAEETDILTDMECGFRFAMFSGTATSDDGSTLEFSASSGGGCGSTWVTVTVNGRYFRIDIRKIVETFVDHVSA